MSKWSDDFEKTHKDVRSIRRVTRELIAKGGKLALERYHSEISLKELKKKIKEK